MQALLPLVGRILLAAIFLWSCIKSIQKFESTAADLASHMGVTGTFIPQALLVGGIVCLMLGSLALILGLKARWGAVLLIVFLIPTTIIYHPPMGIEGELIEFMKNLALIGALLMVVSFGPGPVSFDGPAPSMKR
jgi:uncharacterized membrane protein YphA (DoxX/SURF4 family)